MSALASIRAKIWTRHDRKIRKESRPANWNQGLDLARGIAVLLVVYSHGLPILSNSTTWQAINNYSGFFLFFKPGWWGVRIFFALSGYLIGRQTISILNKGSLTEAAQFTFRRWIRTVPTYWILLAIICSWQGIPWLSGTAARNALFLQTAGTSANNTSLIEVAWSLVIEEWSYAFIAAILIISTALSLRPSRKHAARVLALMALASWIWSIQARTAAADLEWMNWDLMKKAANLQLDSLAAGCTLASIEILAPKVFHALTTNPVTVGLISTITMSLMGAWINTTFNFGNAPLTRDWQALASYGYTLSGIAACLFICSMWNIRDQELPNWITKPLHVLAATSYSLYLVHFPIANALRDLPREINAIAVFAIYCGISIATSTAFWLLFESPFIWIRKRLHTDQKKEDQTQIQPFRPNNFT
jgi:peptidoglycan/LPS O-acetylase OafA/YrhL